jgi:hypothetical protein
MTGGKAAEQNIPHCPKCNEKLHIVVWKGVDKFGKFWTCKNGDYEVKYTRSKR